MASLKTLRRRAAASTARRGHHMRWSLIHGEGFSIWSGACQDCGATVSCRSNPLPNQADIAGDAVAVDCPVPPRSE